MSVNRTLKIEAGSDWSHGFLVNLAGVPLDASWSVKAEVRPDADGEPVLYTWSTGAGNAVVLDGLVTLTVPAATSSAWPWVSGVYDLMITKAGLAYRVASGAVFVRPQVTR